MVRRFPMRVGVSAFVRTGLMQGFRAACLVLSMMVEAKAAADLAQLSRPVAVSTAAPDRQALVVVPATLGGGAPARMALAQADAARYRDLLRLLGFQVTLVQADTRPELKAAFNTFAGQVKPGGEVAVLVLGALLPKDEDLYLVAADAHPPLDQYPTEGLRLADALQPIAGAGARETVLIVDECHDALGQSCRVGGTTVPDGVSAIVGARATSDRSGQPVAGLASLRGEMMPLIQREGLSFLELYGALRARLAGTNMTVAATPSLTRGFAFLPSGFLAGLPSACNRVDPEADAGTLKGANPVDPLIPACAQAATTWSFAPWFKDRLAAVREQSAFQHAASGCRTASIRAYLDAYPAGRYASAVRAIEQECEAERKSAEAPPPTPTPLPPAAPPESTVLTCTVGGLDPAGNNWLALRDAPNRQSRWSTTRMGPGTVVTAFARSDEWVRVRLASGETGWANGKFLFCAAGRPPPAAAPEQPTPRAGCFVTGLDPAGDNWLALRSSPSFKSGWSKTRMGPDTPLVLLGNAGEWLHVRLASGETGWASSRYVRCGR